jgi:hypothetical protein
MAELAEPLKPARLLDQSRRQESAVAFSCGGNGRSWELAVNAWAQRVCSGGTTEPQTIVALEDANGSLVGLSSFKPSAIHPLLYREPLWGVPYIHMIGTDRRYHRKRLADGSSPGDALLAATLDAIRDAWDGVLPHVWALVNPKNHPSHAMFSRHGFGEISPVGKGDAIRVRAPRP